MNTYIMIRIRADTLIVIFILLLMPIISYYVSLILKRVILKTKGFEFQKNQGLKGPKKFQSKYVKKDKQIRVNVVDNISIIKLLSWINKDKQ